MQKKGNIRGSAAFHDYPEDMSVTRQQDAAPPKTTTGEDSGGSSFRKRSNKEVEKGPLEWEGVLEKKGGGTTPLVGGKTYLKRNFHLYHNVLS